MIIGLTGIKRSGKNTVASLIEKKFGGEYEIYQHSFAAKLKESAAATLGIPEHIGAIEYCDWLKENTMICVDQVDPITHMRFTVHMISGREFLQFYGTEAHREIFGDDFWVDVVLDNIPKAKKQTNRLDIVTDVRFPNEAEAIRKKHGFVIRIVRPQVEDENDSHASEKPLPVNLIDRQILNNNSIDALESEVISLMKDLLNDIT